MSIETSTSRAERIEKFFRAQTMEKLVELVKVLAPTEVYVVGAYKYSELVIYVRDLLNVEVAAATGKVDPPPMQI